MSEKRYRVLVRGAPRLEAATTIEEWHFEHVTEAQAFAYANGDPDWRNAGAPTSLLERIRGWVRIG